MKNILNHLLEAMREIDSAKGKSYQSKFSDRLQEARELMTDASESLQAGIEEISELDVSA